MSDDELTQKGQDVLQIVAKAKEFTESWALVEGARADSLAAAAVDSLMITGDGEPIPDADPGE